MCTDGQPVPGHSRSVRSPCGLSGVPVLVADRDVGQYAWFAFGLAASQLMLDTPRRQLGTEHVKELSHDHYVCPSGGWRPWPPCGLPASATAWQPASDNWSRRPGQESGD